MTRRLYILAAVAAVVALVGGCSDEGTAELPALGATLEATSVSGISSGAYMAGQFEIAHSRDVIGAAIIAGGPYGCSESLYADLIPGPGTALLNLTKAINGCMLNALQSFGVPNPEQLAKRAGHLAEVGRIDPVANVKDDRIYLFSGKDDHTVVPAIVESARGFYQALGVPTDHILFVGGMAAGHGFVTEDKGRACDYTGKPYIVDCDYDQAGALLAQIYGTLKPRADAPTGAFLVFDQRPFTRELSNHGLSDSGIVYVPQAMRRRARLQGAHRVSRLRAEPDVRRRHVRARFGLRSLGRYQRADRAVSANGDDAAQPARLLGLVGLHRRRLPDTQRPADHRGPTHAGASRSAAAAVLMPRQRGTCAGRGS